MAKDYGHELATQAADAIGWPFSALTAAAQLVAARRADLFYRSLDATVGAVGDQRRQLENFMGSEVGRELLGDFARSLIETSSRVAVSALAILYADYTDTVYRKSFKIGACWALRGVRDDTIELFLLGTTPTRRTHRPLLTARSWTLGACLTAKAKVGDFEGERLMMQDLLQ